MKKFIIFLFLTSLWTNIQAESVPFKLPSELMTPYGVIAPLCFLNFTEFANESKPLNIKTDKCLSYSQPYNDYALKSGFIGYNLENEDHSMKLPYIYYRYIGKLKQNDKNLYAFLINWSGGGSGSFAELLTMKLEADQLKINQAIASGDRCNGGVKNAVIKNNKLEYRVNMTPFALFAFENNKLKPNQNTPFADCAVCCIGTLHFIGDKLKGIQFNGQILDTDANEKNQACFNRLTEQFGARKKAFLNPSQLKQLQSKIIHNCMK